MRTPASVARPPAVPARRLTVRRAALALGLVGIAVLLAIVLGAGSLFGHRSSRQAVSQYIAEVNAVQQRMHVPLARVLEAYRRYARGGTEAAAAGPALARAERTLRTLGRRVAEIDAPPEAARLRALLTRLFAAEAGITAEVDTLVRFTPAYRRVLAAAQAAGLLLGKELAAAPVPRAKTVRGTKAQIAKAKAEYAAASRRAAAVQADAVEAYDRRIAAVLRRLLALEPPPILEPAYRSQVRSFRAVRASGERLAAALRGGDRTHVQALGRAFGASARLAASAAAQREEIAAIKAYNARVRAIGALQGRVQAELGRLGNTLR